MGTFRAKMQRRGESQSRHSPVTRLQWEFAEGARICRAENWGKSYTKEQPQKSPQMFPCVSCWNLLRLGKEWGVASWTVSRAQKGWETFVLSGQNGERNLGHSVDTSEGSHLGRRAKLAQSKDYLKLPPVSLITSLERSVWSRSNPSHWTVSHPEGTNKIKPFTV